MRLGDSQVVLAMNEERSIVSFFNVSKNCKNIGFSFLTLEK